MPLFFLLFMSATGQDEDRSWRLTYLIPLLMHILSMAMSLSSQDLPDGNYGELENSGVKQKSKGSAVLKIGLSNVNAWILTLTYGACFGTMTRPRYLPLPLYPNPLTPTLSSVLTLSHPRSVSLFLLRRGAHDEQHRRRVLHGVPWPLARRLGYLG